MFDLACSRAYTAFLFLSCQVLQDQWGQKSGGTVPSDHSHDDGAAPQERGAEAAPAETQAAGEYIARQDTIQRTST
jgi:hypothetical protein